MSDVIDLLQIKIEKARAELPPDTRRAIDSVDWKKYLLELRPKKGYTFEQLGDLELETELLLCGITAPENYPKELSTRMRITKAAADELVNEMNDLVFKKIREELIKITEAKKPPTEKERSNKNEAPLFNQAGIKIINPDAALKTTSVKSEPPEESREDLLSKIEKPDIHPMLVQKLSTPVQTSTVKTEHTLENITKKASIPTSYPPKADPYREIPE